MSIFKKVRLLIPVLLVLSCSRVDKHSPIGADIIAQIDSSAVKYDGVFTTEVLNPAANDWQDIKDPLSGLHRYIDSLARGGAIQSEVLVGSFNGKESFGYLTFSYNDADSMYQKNDNYDPTTGTDEEDTITLKDTVHSVAHVANSYLKEGYDSVTTTLLLYSDTTKHTSQGFSIELSSVGFTKDSTVVDTSKRHVVHSAYLPPKRDKYEIELPYKFYKASEGDTIEYTDINGTIIKNCSLYVIINHKKYLNNEILVDTTFDLITSSYNDTTIFNSSTVSPYYNFAQVDSNLTVVDSSESYRLLQYSYASHWVSYDTLDSGSIVPIYKDTTIEDSIFHSWAITPHSDPENDTIHFIYDSLSYSESYRNKISISDTSVIDINPIDSDTTIYDSVVIVRDTLCRVYNVSVLQQGSTYKDTVSFEPRAALEITDTNQLNTEALDTLNILLKNISKYDNSIFPIKASAILVTAYKDSGTVSTTKPVIPKRSSMTVFNIGDPIATTNPFTSGGEERFVRMKINANNFWSMMNQNKYLSIVQANLELPVVNVQFPEYADSTMNIRMILHDRLLTNGALLSDSGVTSKNVTVHQDSSTIKVDVTEYLVDLYYEKVFGKNIVPPTYLYLWIDGSHMGQIVFDKSKSYNFTYIVQNKKK